LLPSNAVQIVTATIHIHSKFDYVTNDIRIGPNIEYTIRTANQIAHHIAQDITKSNRDIVCIPKIEKISTILNNRVFKSNHDQSN
jgi:hypothetical protein